MSDAIQKDLSLQEVAELCGVSYMSIWRMADRGILPTYRIGTGTQMPHRVKWEDVENLRNGKLTGAKAGLTLLRRSA